MVYNCSPFDKYAHAQYYLILLLNNYNDITHCHGYTLMTSCITMTTMAGKMEKVAEVVKKRISLFLRKRKRIEDPLSLKMIKRISLLEMKTLLPLSLKVIKSRSSLLIIASPLQ